MSLNLKAFTAGGGKVVQNKPEQYSLTTITGQSGTYRLAQLDDYHNLARRDFQWEPPLKMTLQAACSQRNHAGTWGFGLWNDPFSAGLGIGGTSHRLPVLPNCAWFFYAGSQNHLSFDDNIPAQGFLAASFRSPLFPSFLLAPSLIFSPLILIRPFARFVRRCLRHIIKQDAHLLKVDVTKWHNYQLDWQPSEVHFSVDEQRVFKTDITPRGKLALVLWVDNQFAAFPASGKLSFGTAANLEPCSLEINSVAIEQG